MSYQPTTDPTQDFRERIYLPELLRGLAVTTRHFLRNLFGSRDRNPEVIDRRGSSLISTVEYPEERSPYPPGYRGLHRLVPRPDGKPRCVACYMCATVCPAQCIYIEAGEYPVAQGPSESQVIEKYPTVFVIDELRCIVCGYCVDACPKDAIRMDTGTHAKPAYRRQDFSLGIPQLLSGSAVAHPTDPWTRRPGSAEPEHVHKEAHTRINLPQAPTHALPQSSRIEVDTQNPVPVTRFFK